jgi:hypothetical protein
MLHFKVKTVVWITSLVGDDTSRVHWKRDEKGLDGLIDYETAMNT